MKFSQKGTTIVEAIIVMMIISVWVIGMYDIFSRSQKLSDSSVYRLQAISMAKEGIEAITNIRDTNWLLFPANTDYCWNTVDYSSSCITTDSDIPSGSYVIFKWANDRWSLSGSNIHWDYSSVAYRNAYKVHLDSNGFYTQSWGVAIKPLFTRELQISYPPDAWTPLEKMNIKSIVRWKDNSGSAPHEIILESLLTNWKK